jgi:hypothetical protein
MVTGQCTQMVIDVVRDKNVMCTTIGRRSRAYRFIDIKIKRIIDDGLLLPVDLYQCCHVLVTVLLFLIDTVFTGNDA